MHTLRIPIAALAGAAFTASMFWLLWSLVTTSFDVGDTAQATRIEFSRMRRDTANASSPYRPTAASSMATAAKPPSTRACTARGAI